ncbi:sirohydrochlorin chelatase [Peribacillus asahii]|uniref:sirohydrochlorin chelatase n=1 Tax=Peribacillus asahii TaxID=228899 RepID=UPI0037FA3672
MKAVLYVCHGSRVQEGCQQAIEFVQKTQQLVSVPIQEISFLELAHPTIEEGFTRCIEQGATEIAVMPVLLLAAGHVKKDIPEELEVLQARHPHVKISFGKPFGVHERIVDILLERIQEKTTVIDENTAILLVGRGSSDADTVRNFEEIIHLFHNKTNFSYVAPCFLAAAKPRFEDLLEETLARDIDSIIVIPYLLFTGLLIKGVEKTIDMVQSDKNITLCDYLGFHPYLREILADRVNEALQQEGMVLAQYA